MILAETVTLSLVYFMGRGTEIVSFNHYKYGHEYEFIASPEDYDFLDNYIAFLVSQNLAVIDYSDYLIDIERKLVPVIVAPLTSRGRELIELLSMHGHSCSVEESVLSLNKHIFSRKLNNIYETMKSLKANNYLPHVE